MAYSGASNETCGGPNRLSVYARSGPPSVAVINDGSDHEWIARGCFDDLTYARILSQGVTVQGGGQNNSAQSCAIQCRQQRFKYAGTEYASECEC